MSLLEVRGLSRSYRNPRAGARGDGSVTHALRPIDFDLAAGETLAVIGESGSGKTTLMRLLLALDRPSSGTVRFDGREVVAGPARSLRWLRRETGIVLQDPYSSLDPRMRIGTSVAEPLRALGIDGDRAALVRGVLERVGLDPELAERYPHELSGGQRQRVALSRAIVHRPRLLIGDEPLSALDVTVRAQVLELLRSLHHELGLAMVIVSHDIGLVHHIADRVLVMHDGELVEQGASAEVLGAPQHPYTRRLLAAAPRLA
ncbi:ABC transporter ATP-binding protein [Gryllotalpicola daejeonensis]|uniref:ABC transporter ATP-binding protein n=1 Tax=Gryllotalpicola daejeonensis TaxID=993087 RepID=A0ABP7ZNF9_9MICO